MLSSSSSVSNVSSVPAASNADGSMAARASRPGTVSSACNPSRNTLGQRAISVVLCQEQRVGACSKLHASSPLHSAGRVLQPNLLGSLRPKCRLSSQVHVPPGMHDKAVSPPLMYSAAYEHHQKCCPASKRDCRTSRMRLAASPAAAADAAAASASSPARALRPSSAMLERSLASRMPRPRSAVCRPQTQAMARVQGCRDASMQIMLLCPGLEPTPMLRVETLCLSRYISQYPF